MYGKRGQGALEFLMTYGWALLVVLVSLGSLTFYFGYDSSSFASETCFLGPGLGCSDMMVNEDSMSLNVRNSLGKDMTSFSISSVNCGIPSYSPRVDNGDEALLILSECSFTAGDLIDESLDVSYTFLNSNLDHIKDASLTAVVESGYAQSFGGGSGGGGSGGYGTDGNTTALYKFDEGTENFIGDSSGNGLDGFFFDDTVALMHMDGDRDDLSANNILFSCTDCPAYINSDVSGQGLLFDGVNNGLLASWSQDFDDELTLEAWFRYDGAGSGNSNRILEITDSSGGSIKSSAIVVDINNDIRAWVYCDGARITTKVENGVQWLDGAWHHIVYTHGGISGKIYIDGVNRAQTDTSCTDIENYEKFSVGMLYLNGDNNFKGGIDELSVYKRAISATEVQEHFASKVAEFSGWSAGKYGSAVELYGDANYIQIPYSTNLEFTDQFTLEFWFYPTNMDLEDQRLVHKSGSWGAYTHLGGLVFFVDTTESGGGREIIVEPLSSGSWYHFAGSYDGQNMFMYVDGVEVDDSPKALAENIDTSSAKLFIGSDGGAKFFNGLIDEIRVSDYARYN
ncbi:LamG domain-containing protein [Candidatus Woesearchaeota archaeon]|jgi:hypothetical protein|nr:LamG domain-containing protein [Candidatus Woesearchaeota archaeon]MBT6044992.1 LamG domain-containing protein [Candidatus Woesearchaeota archaeon]